MASWEVLCQWVLCLHAVPLLLHVNVRELHHVGGYVRHSNERRKQVSLRGYCPTSSRFRGPHHHPRSVGIPAS